MTTDPVNNGLAEMTEIINPIHTNPTFQGTIKSGSKGTRGITISKVGRIFVITMTGPPREAEMIEAMVVIDAISILTEAPAVENLE